MANGVTSQWFDIHVKLGNYLPLQKEPTLFQLQTHYVQSKQSQQQQKLQNIKIDQQLDQLEDQLGNPLLQDQEFYNSYKAKRMAEIKQLAKHKHYGSLYQIRRDQYITQVTEASQQSFVVLNLYQDYIEKSLFINQLMSQLAQKYTQVKFIKIVATKCVQNFPDNRVPCMIVYRGGKPVFELGRVDEHMKEAKLQSLQFLLQGVLQEKGKQARKQEQ